MYAMCGRLIAKPNQRGQLVEILLRAAQMVGQLSSCHLYAVTEDLADEVTVWVMEIWDDKEAHDASLKDEHVRALIAEAMPLMGGAPSGSELKVAGGHGV
ncbi:MAG TPA: antibiotic biosynthesis monooxygenase [Anaerolineales bacterium]|nr:antibiotic biosynthesis monooxygenase [Anaerolineales bacterium]HMX74253.1 antibiotic biosynthesis monooxygenase [Anaerolineales bacterium]HMZ43019.1 antibiotic biosynthesis monooxygenase [Anaerolineales bacterium]HNB34730.1 antibiotic biosynthesis monooxygenase [Anaerolineales bacterium]HNB34872.1 antibiotic biosynthesis monooxygenase [Anaerolineales bacterium]